MSIPPLVALVGPTGSGKSQLALRLAEKLGGEVVNCDSVQIYKQFDIGTAKLPASERRGIPHHLIDVLEPGELFTAGDYARKAREALREIAGRGLIPIVVGGTGFYLKALLDGLFPGPPRDEALRARLKARAARRPGSLHRLLTRLDRASADRIHPRDVNKTMRALEVRLLAGKPLSHLFAAGREALEGFRVLKVGLNPPRAELYARLNQRAERMFRGGLPDEIRAMLARGVPRDAKALESVGYREALEYLNGKMTFEEALEEAQKSTRRYAKRQWTWFHRDPEVEWFDGFGDEDSTERAVIRWVVGCGL